MRAVRALSNFERQVESDEEPKKEEKEPKEKIVQKDITIQEEEYDYEENDDTKEDGEISGSEMFSPVHQVFKKLAPEERRHNWGVCNVFFFSKVSMPATEHVLQEHKIHKLNSSRDVLIESDPDDLIFVKEIREDRVIHEIEPDVRRSRGSNDVEEIIATEESENSDGEGEVIMDGEDAESEASGSSNVDADVVEEEEYGVIEQQREEDNEIVVGERGDENQRKDRRRQQITENFENKKPRENATIVNHKTKEQKKLENHKGPHKGSLKDGAHPSKSSSKSEDPKTILYITNLVRPFTVSQLKELLQRTGKIKDFWIDAIKSKCYVQYGTEDEAIETRHAIHGIHWPINNPKVLNVHFATQDELLRAQTCTDISEIPRKTRPLIIDCDSPVPTRNQEVVRRIDWKRHEEKPFKKNIGIREWDIGKPQHPDEDIVVGHNQTEKKPHLEDQGLEDRRARKSRRSKTPDDSPPKKKSKKEAEEKEGKLLDDLFRRTKTTPSIYWLPLTDEQIAEKEAARRRQLELINERMQQKSHEKDSRRRSRERSRRRNSRRRK